MGKKNAPNAYFIELTKTLSSNRFIIFLDIHSGIKFGSPKIDEKTFLSLFIFRLFGKSLDEYSRALFKSSKLILVVNLFIHSF